MDHKRNFIIHDCMGSIRRDDLLIFVYRLIHYKQMDLYAISEDPN